MKKSVRFSILFIVLALCGLASAEWTPPQPAVDGINTPAHEFYPFLSFDGKTLYFSRGDGSHYDIWQATREDTSGPFTSVIKALPRGSKWCVLGPWVSPDNLRMYYHDEGASWTMKVSTRASVSDPWTPGTTIPGLSSFTNPDAPKLSEDELTIVFNAKNAPGGMGDWDIYIATRPNISSPFDNIRNLSEINSSAIDDDPFLTPDGLTLYFASTRNGSWQLFKATRASRSEPFGNLEHLSFFDSSYGVTSPFLSADGSTIFFAKGMSSSGFCDIYFSNLITDPVEIAIMKVNAAIDEKIRALGIIDNTLDKESEAVAELEKALENEDYGDLKKGDIVKAMEKIHSAIQHQEQSQKDLEKSIEKLEDALEALGAENDSNQPE